MCCLQICMSINAPVVGRRDLGAYDKRNILKRYAENLRCCQGHLCNNEYGSLPTKTPGNLFTSPTSTIFTQSSHTGMFHNHDIFFQTLYILLHTKMHLLFL